MFRKRAPVFALRGMCLAFCALLLATAPVAGQDGKPIKILTHTIQKGETLRSIAEYYYANSARWPEVQHFNQIDDPRKIFAGQEIEVPFYKKEVWNYFCGRIGEPSLKIWDDAGEDFEQSGPPAASTRSETRIVVYTFGYIVGVLLLAAILRYYGRRETLQRLRQSERRYTRRT